MANAIILRARDHLRSISVVAEHSGAEVRTPLIAESQGGIVPS
jgi:hypothetical protein